MSTQDWGIIATAVLAIATAIGTLIKTAADRRIGVRGAEHTARRDTVADRDAFIDQLQEQLSDANQRAAASEIGRLDAVSRLEAEREYSQVLRDHIYRRLDPPPPARPTT